MLKCGRESLNSQQYSIKTALITMMELHLHSFVSLRLESMQVLFWYWCKNHTIVLILPEHPSSPSVFSGFSVKHCLSFRILSVCPYSIFVFDNKFENSNDTVEENIILNTITFINTNVWNKQIKSIYICVTLES